MVHTTAPTQVLTIYSSTANTRVPLVKGAAFPGKREMDHCAVETKGMSLCFIFIDPEISYWLFKKILHLDIFYGQCP